MLMDFDEFLKDYEVDNKIVSEKKDVLNMLERVSSGMYKAAKAGSEKARSDLLNAFTSKLRQFKRDKPQIRFEIDPQASSFLTYLSLGLRISALRVSLLVFAKEVSNDADESNVNAEHAQKLTELAATQAFGVVPTPGERIPISIPSKFTGKDSSVNVRLWMKQLLRYFKLKSAKPSDYGKLAVSFLEGIALQIWEVELNDLELQSKPVTWETFQEVLVTFFGSQTPARDMRIKYNKCVQVSSVAEYVKSLKSIVQLLMRQPSDGDVIDHFVMDLSLRRKHG